MRRSATLVIALVAIGLLLCAVFLWQRDAALRTRGGSDAAGGADSAGDLQKRAWARHPAPSEALTPSRERDDASDASSDATDKARLLGHVKNAVSGVPIAGAELTLSSANAELATATSDSSGAFVFSVDRSGTYALSAASAPGYLPASDGELTQWVASAGHTSSGVVVALRPAVDYVGLVVNAEGEPVAGATITLLGATNEEVPRNWLSDVEGVFHFHAADEALLEAEHPRHGHGRARLDAAAQIQHKLRIVLSHAARAFPRDVSGVVVDDHGDAVAGARVSAEAKVKLDTSVHQPSTVTGDDGAFVLHALDPSGYTLRAEAEGHAPGSVALAPAEVVPVRIVLPAACPIDATFKGDGQASESWIRADAAAPAVPATPLPVTSVHVSVVADQGLAPPTLYEANIVPGAHGQATIRALGPGDYRVLAAADGFAQPAAPATIHVAAPCARQRLDALFGHGYTLEGEVRDAQSQAPLPWALVRLEQGLLAHGETRAGADGSFVLTGVPPGKRSFYVAAQDHDPRIVGPLFFGPAEAVRAERILLSPVKDGEQPKLELAGIGVGLEADADALRVTRVFPGSGAEQAGLRVDDRILSVDDARVSELGFSGCMEHIRGPIGSSVRLSIRRGEAVSEVTVTRAKIRA